MARLHLLAAEFRPWYDLETRDAARKSYLHPPNMCVQHSNFLLDLKSTLFFDRQMAEKEALTFIPICSRCDGRARNMWKIIIV